SPGHFAYRAVSRRSLCASRCSILRKFQRARHVRIGSKADMCAAKRHVRFTPNSDRKGEFPQRAMSALPPKADMCGARADVRFGPKADIRRLRAQKERPPCGGLSKVV